MKIYLSTEEVKGAIKSYVEGSIADEIKIIKIETPPGTFSILLDDTTIEEREIPLTEKQINNVTKFELEQLNKAGKK